MANLTLAIFILLRNKLVTTVCELISFTSIENRLYVQTHFFTQVLRNTRTYFSPLLATMLRICWKFSLSPWNEIILYTLAILYDWSTEILINLYSKLCVILWGFLLVILFIHLSKIYFIFRCSCYDGDCGHHCYLSFD